MNRSLRKEKKAYLVHWTACPDESRRFENLMAFFLLRACLVWTDLALGKAELWYVRTFDKKEVDFLLTLDGKPALLIEAQLAEMNLSPFQRRLAQEWKIPLLQVVHRPGIFRKSSDALVLSADRLLSVLP